MALNLNLTLSSALDALRKHARGVMQCDVCGAPPERVLIEGDVSTLDTLVRAVCAHGAARIGTVEWSRAAKIDIVRVTDAEMLLPRLWRQAFMFFRRGFSCYPRDVKRRTPRPAPAWQARRARVDARTIGRAKNFARVLALARFPGGALTRTFP